MKISQKNVVDDGICHFVLLTGTNKFHFTVIDVVAVQGSSGRSLKKGHFILGNFYDFLVPLIVLLKKREIITMEVENIQKFPSHSRSQRSNVVDKRDRGKETQK